MNSTARHALRGFVMLNAVLAAAMVVWMGRPTGSVGTMILWFVACLVGEAFWIRTPTSRGTISMALTIDIAALFTLTPATSLAVIGLTTLLAGIYPHRRPWYKVLFNASQSIIAAAAALMMLRVMSDGANPDGLASIGMTWLPLFAAGGVFYLVNSGLVSIVLALESSGRLWKVWRQNYGYGFELWCTVAQISLSGFVLAAYHFMGALAVLGLLPVIGVLWWSSARESAVRASAAREETEKPDRLKLAG